MINVAPYFSNDEDENKDVVYNDRKAFEPDEEIFYEGRRFYLKNVPFVQGEIVRVENGIVVCYFGPPNKKKTYEFPFSIFNIYFSFEKEPITWYDQTKKVGLN